MCRPSRLTKRGDLEVVLIASRACGGRGSVGMMAAGRAGSPCEPETACRRATLNAYGKTVWSWPSLLRSSRIEDVREPNRADGIIQFGRRGRPKESSAPGRARHKPSDHRAGKAVWSATPVCCCAVLSACAFRAADRGCEPAPGLPCALLDQRAERSSKARAIQAARLQSHVWKPSCVPQARSRRVGKAQACPRPVASGWRSRARRRAPLPTLRHRRWDLHWRTAMTMRKKLRYARLTTKSVFSAQIPPDPNPCSAVGDRVAGCCCCVRTKRRAARHSR